MGKASKIMIITKGTRGDVQPFIAIASALQSAGYKVLVSSNEDHEKFTTDFGLAFRPIFMSAEAALTRGSVSESLKNGDVFAYLRGLKEAAAEDAPLICERFIGSVQEFKPDLIVEGMGCHYWSRFAAAQFDIPVMSVKLTAVVYNPSHMVLGLPTLPCGCHRFLFEKLASAAHDGMQLMDAAMMKQAGCSILQWWTKSVATQEFLAPWYPEYICQSPSWKHVLCPPTNTSHNFVGACVIQAAAQKGDSFGGNESMKSMEAFLSAGPRPVYCGWGSMTCKSQEHMVALAVKALMHSQQRGIVLGGWAKLGMSALTNATKDTALLAYAEKNILFVESVSHEWLFSKVLCTVHHGGAGTTVAAMRGGVPTIITPVFLDQFDSAYLVNNLGVGIGFGKQLQKITAEELGNAIKEVQGSSEMAAKAKEMCDTLKEENGTSNMVTAVEDFWHQWVESGKYRAKISEIKMAKEEVQTNSSQRRFSCSIQ